MLLPSKSIERREKSALGLVLVLLLSGRGSIHGEEDLEMALMAAVLSDDAQKAVELLKGGADPNKPLFSAAGERLDGPLAVAVLEGRARMARVLIKYGADVCADRGKLATYAIYYKPPKKKVPTLESAGGEVRQARADRVRKFNRGWFRHAIKEVDVESLLRLKDQEEEIPFYAVREEVLAALERRDGELVTALLWPQAGPTLATADALRVALERKDLTLLRRLVAGGIELNGTDKDGRLPLVLAARWGQVEAVEELIAGGADVNLWASMQETALGEALEAGHEDIASILVDAGARGTLERLGPYQQPLTVAAEYASPEFFRRLLRQPSMTDPTGDIVTAAFAQAGKRGRTQIVDEIKQARDRQSLTPLAVSGSVCRTETMRSLLDAGLDPNRPYYGRYSVIEAVGCQNEDIVHLLAAAGADLDVRDEDGQTALMVAVKKGASRKKEVIEALLDEGADPSLTDPQGETVLMKAAVANAAPGVVEALLANGVDANRADLAGRTALMKASEAENRSAIDALLSAGVDESLVDRQGRTAWQLYWAKVTEGRKFSRFPSLRGELGMQVPKGLGDYGVKRLDDEEYRLFYTDVLARDRVELHVSWLGRPIDPGSFDAEVITDSRMPELFYESRQGDRVPVVLVRPKDEVALIAALPWDQDTLILRISGRSDLERELRWNLRGIIQSVRFPGEGQGGERQAGEGQSREEQGGGEEAPGQVASTPSARRAARLPSALTVAAVIILALFLLVVRKTKNVR